MVNEYGNFAQYVQLPCLKTLSAIPETTTAMHVYFSNGLATRAAILEKPLDQSNDSKKI